MDASLIQAGLVGAGAGAPKGKGGRKPLSEEEKTRRAELRAQDRAAKPRGKPGRKPMSEEEKEKKRLERNEKRRTGGKVGRKPKAGTYEDLVREHQNGTLTWEKLQSFNHDTRVKFQRQVDVNDLISGELELRHSIATTPFVTRGGTLRKLQTTMGLLRDKVYMWVGAKEKMYPDLPLDLSEDEMRHVIALIGTNYEFTPERVETALPKMMARQAKKAKEQADKREEAERLAREARETKEREAMAKEEAAEQLERWRERRKTEDAKRKVEEEKERVKMAERKREEGEREAMEREERLTRVANAAPVKRGDELWFKSTPTHRKYLKNIAKELNLPAPDNATVKRFVLYVNRMGETMFGKYALDTHMRDFFAQENK